MFVQWHQRMFAMAAPNLRVDGQNFENFVEQPSECVGSYLVVN
jgi:hypothetical protein